MSTLYAIEQANRRALHHFEIWHDDGIGADRRGEDPHFPLTPEAGYVEPGRPYRPRDGLMWRRLVRVFTAEVYVPVDGRAASFIYRLLTDPERPEFRYCGTDTDRAARQVAYAYAGAGLRSPRWGDVVVTANEHGRVAHLIHACWPMTDDPEAGQ